MNILYHHRTQGKGVERVHILGIVNAWRRAGHNVEIVSPPGIHMERPEAGENQQRKEKFWKQTGESLHGIFFELLEIAYNFWAYFNILGTLRRTTFNFIFERYSFLCLAGFLASKKYSLPFLLEVNYTSRTPIFRTRSRFIKFLERHVEYMLFDRADGIVVVSKYLQEHLLGMGIDGNKIIVLPNATDPLQFDPKLDARELRSNLGLARCKVVGFTGYFYPWHGIELLLDSYHHVKNQFENVVFLLVGDGPTYEETKNKVSANGLAHSIRLVGKVSHNEVPRHIALFDVAVMPHSNVYGSPMKIPEYMAMCKAVVAPRLGPIEDIIEDGNNGVLFESNDIYQLATKIVGLLKDDQYRSRIGKAARTSVMQKFNWNRNAERILELYHRTEC